MIQTAAVKTWIVAFFDPSYGFEAAESDNTKYWIVKNGYKMPKLLIFEIEKSILFWNQYLNTGPQTPKHSLQAQKSIPRRANTDI